MMNADAASNNKNRSGWWKRLLCSLGVITSALTLGVGASRSPVVAQGVDYRSAASAPAAWQDFAKRLQTSFQDRLAADDAATRQFQDFVAKREGGARALTLVIRTWVLPNGKVERIEFDGLDDNDIASICARFLRVVLSVPRRRTCFSRCIYVFHSVPKISHGRDSRMRNRPRTPKSLQPTAGWQWAVAFALGFAHVLVPKLASAESVWSATSFDARFAAVASAAETKGATANGGADRKQAGDDGAKAELPPSRAIDARARYRILIENEVARAGLAPEIAEAVMAVESGYNPGAIGGVGEIGLMQILPSTARMLGFVGTNADLAVPETNIHYGVTYLAQAWRLAGGDLCTAVMKYRAGHGESRFSFLSVNYCLAVRSKLAARGFRVTGSVPVATFGESSGGCGRKCLGGSRVGRVNLAALNTQLSSLVVQVRAGR